MSFFTHLLETTSHFGLAIEQLEKGLETEGRDDKERIKSLVKLAYCYAYVQLQKGLARADEAIDLAEKISDLSWKGNALCAKAMNELRIGFLTRARLNAEQAYSIFKSIGDEEGQADACFQLGSLPYLSQSTGDPASYSELALKKYESLNDSNGVYLVRIQELLSSFINTQFEEGSRKVHTLLKELTMPYQRHLLCFTHMQFSLGMYLKQDVTAFMNGMLEWQRIATANGNFHDYTMTKAMLPDCLRLQQLNNEVMSACLESMECTEKLGSIRGHITVALVMAFICSDQQQFDDSLFYFQKAANAALEIQDTYQYNMALNAIGEVYLKLGETGEALKAFKKAQQESKIVNDRLNLIKSQRNLAELAYREKDYDNAFFGFKNLFDNANNSDGWDVQDNGNYASAIAKASDSAICQAGFQPHERNTMRYYYLKKYLDLAREQKNLRMEANALKSLSEYCEETSDLAQAVQLSKEYIQLYGILVNEESIKSMAELRLHFETEKKEQQIDLLKKEKEKALLNERLRISRELHDEVGATLSGIAMYSHLTREQMKSGTSDDVNKSLNLIQESSTDMVNKLNDIVWLINPGQDSLEKLIQRLEEYARDMTIIKKMKFMTKVPEHMEKHDLPVETRRNIYLFCKEAINNAVKYSGGTMLGLNIEATHGKLQVSITDNGKGFNPELVKRGNGLENMQKRADEIGAKLVFKPGKIRGMSVSIISSLYSSVTI